MLEDIRADSPPFLLKKLLPSMDAFLTKDYIDNIIKTEHWVEHGSHLEYWLMDIRDDDDFPESIRDLSDEEIITSEPFKEYLEKWLKLRYNYVVGEMEEEIKAFPLEVSRTVYLSKEEQDKLVAGDLLDIGRYWGTCQVAAWNAENTEGLLETTVTATVSQADIDWVETMRSRMDYANGDDEKEIYVHERGQPVIKEIYCEEKEMLPVPNNEVPLAVQKHLCDWLLDDFLEPQEINSGECAFFADSFFRSPHGKELASKGIEPDVNGVWEEGDIELQNLRQGKPSWANWNKIDLLIKKDVYGHAFIVCDGKYYDAECVRGVECAFDLPLFERAAGEYAEIMKKERLSESSETLTI